MPSRFPIAGSTVLLVLAAACRTGPAAPTAPPARPNENRYTRYELGSPEDHRFDVSHEFAVTTPGARVALQYLRGGVFVRGASATDLASGRRLPLGLVDGEVARAHGFADGRKDDRYFLVPLEEPVPEGGERRLAIGLSIEDPASYRCEGERISFQRAIGVERASVVLPRGHELVAIDHPVQLETQADGRIAVHLVRTGTGTVHVALTARRLPAGADTSGPRGPVFGASAGASLPGGAVRFGRDAQDHEVVYRLGAPESHTFELVHELTRGEPGAREVLAVVRPGSRISAARARLIDTGETLATEIRSGAGVQAAGVLAEAELRPDSEVLVVTHPAVPAHGSLRLQLEESLADLERYALEEGELVWRYALEAPRNEVVLPPGWYPCASSMPATVSEDEDGRIRLVYVNPRPDVLALHLRARPRTGSAGGEAQDSALQRDGQR